MSETVALLQIASLGLAACCAIALLVWAASVPLRDVSIVDSAWSLLVLAPALVALAFAPPGNAAWLLPVEPVFHVSRAPESWAAALARLRSRAS